MATERIIAEAFYDEKKSFGSIQHTLSRARQKDASITRADVKAFLDNQEVKPVSYTHLTLPTILRV